MAAPQLPHGSVAIFQHTNPGDSTDPSIGFWICLMPGGGSKYTPITAAQLNAVSPGTTHPIPTLAAAQNVITQIQAYYAATYNRLVQPGVNGNDVMQGTPITV